MPLMSFSNDNVIYLFVILFQVERDTFTDGHRETKGFSSLPLPPITVQKKPHFSCLVHREVSSGGPPRVVDVSRTTLNTPFDIAFGKDISTN